MPLQATACHQKITKSSIVYPSYLLVIKSQFLATSLLSLGRGWVVIIKLKANLSSTNHWTSQLELSLATIVRLRECSSITTAGFLQFWTPADVRLKKHMLRCVLIKDLLITLNNSPKLIYSLTRNSSKGRGAGGGIPKYRPMTTLDTIF